MKFMTISALMICACAAGAADVDVDNTKHKDENVTLDSLPASVKKAVDKEAGTNGVKGVTKSHTKDGKTVYQVKIKVEDGKDRVLYINEDGTQSVGEH